MYVLYFKNRASEYIAISEMSSRAVEVDIVFYSLFTPALPMDEKYVGYIISETFTH